MSKRILSALLALVLVIGLFPSAHAATTDSGLEYEVYEDHVEITGYTGTATEVVIPEELEGKPVTVVGPSAFEGHEELTSITLPSCLEKIDQRAFEWCRSLTSLYIPANVNSIPVSAFERCESLVSILVDEKNESYISIDGILYTKSGKNNDVHALLRCPGGKDGDIVIPDSVTRIYNRAFAGCISISSVTIPASVDRIGGAALAECPSLREITVDSANSTYCSIDGVLFNKDATTLILCPGGKTGPYTVPDSVVSIDGAFNGCHLLTAITLPDTLTDLGTFTFQNCSSLTAMTLPEGITEIGMYLFWGCTSLNQISIPEGVTSIGQEAFCGCGGLTEVAIPAAVSSIDGLAFGACFNLERVNFLGNAPSIHGHAFSGVTATAYYPAGNLSWTAEVMQDYGGSITWVPDSSIAPANPFTDVPAGSFYEKPVLWALENNITTGATADTFNPNGQCLRAQVVTFLHRAAGNPEPTADSNPFTDVKTSDFFYKPVLWAVEKGITNGVSPTEFGSYAVCNRAAVVTFLWRAAGSPEPAATDNPFTDVKDTDFFYKPVLWAIENGITNGISATEFGPTADCNRAQVVTFLYRAYN